MNGAERTGEWCLALANLTQGEQSQLTRLTNLDPETGYTTGRYYTFGSATGHFWGAESDDPRALWLDLSTGAKCNASAAEGNTICVPFLEVRASGQWTKGASCFARARASPAAPPQPHTWCALHAAPPNPQRNVTGEYCPPSSGFTDTLFCGGGVPISDLRLVGGPNSTTGRLEVLVGDTWGTVSARFPSLVKLGSTRLALTKLLD